MKKALILLASVCSFHALQAQSGNIKANISDGADPAAVNIQFLPGDATADPKTGDITIHVPLKATVRNIGSKPYLPGNEPLVVYLYRVENGQDIPVEHKAVNILQAGTEVTLQHTGSYIKGKQEPPKFKLAFLAKTSGVPNPDVSLANNRKMAQTPK
jgi:hypothetical protein